MSVPSLNAQFTVVPQEAVKFAKVWTYKGLSIPIGDEHCQFATDFANIVLRNFIVMCKQRAVQAAAAQTQAQASASLIVEGS